MAPHSRAALAIAMQAAQCRHHFVLAHHQALVHVCFCESPVAEKSCFRILHKIFFPNQLGNPNKILDLLNDFPRVLDKIVAIDDHQIRSIEGSKPTLNVEVIETCAEECGRVVTPEEVGQKPLNGIVPDMILPESLQVVI